MITVLVDVTSPEARKYLKDPGESVQTSKWLDIIIIAIIMVIIITFRHHYNCLLSIYEQLAKKAAHITSWGPLQHRHPASWGFQSEAQTPLPLARPLARPLASLLWKSTLITHSIAIEEMALWAARGSIRALMSATLPTMHIAPHIDVALTLLQKMLVRCTQAVTPAGP